MAKFKEHISFCAVINASVCTAVYTFGLFTGFELIYLFLIGIIGTMLPDLDSDSSKPLKLSYTFLSFTIPIVLIYYLIHLNLIGDIKNNFKQISLLYLASFFTIFILFRIIMKITKHRGLIHSIPMAILVSLILMFTLYYLNYSKNFILFSGLFLFLGYIAHLILDEIYSVVKLKKSFGTAFKLYSKDNLYGTSIIYSTIIFLIYLFPYKLIDFEKIITYFLNFV